MKKILLVDDDLRAIEGIAANLDWDSMGIEKCICVSSAREAKRRIREEDISIVVADIDMPEENGLELVEWINANTRNVVCIFLTSYADFEYTSKALRLGSCDYLLKPAPYTEVEAAVRRAVSRLGMLRQQELSSRYAAYWSDSLPALREQFWRDVISGRIPPDRQNILRQAERRHLPPEEGKSRLILFELPDIGAIRWEMGLIEAAMTNILGEVFAYPGDGPVVMHHSGSSYFVRISRNFSREQLPELCTGTVNVLESLFCGTVLCVIGEAVYPEELHPQTVRLLECRLEAGEEGFLCVHGDRGSEFKDAMTLWMRELADGMYALVLQKIRSYLEHTSLQPYQLVQLQRSLNWKLYQLISQKQLDPGKFLMEENIHQLSGKAADGPEDLLRWLEWMLRRLAEEDPEAKNSVVVQIQNYIREHIAEDLNRESLAKVTFLSVDYISHLFSQKTGQCLSDYIIHVRMEKAKQLLRGTNIPVARVAIGVGYNNISYFSRLFKRETGMTPQRYRKLQGKEQG